MNNIFGTEIFWMTLVYASIILTGVTLIGHAFCKLVKCKFELSSIFYLAPATGLAILLIISSVVGRITPLGNSNISLFVLAVLVASIFIIRKNILQTLRRSLAVSIFGIICGVSVLAPLFVFGAFNSHNDAFTYLVHSDWLQAHAFNEHIAIDDATPLTTQIIIYQSSGLRMGGSFLLALMQSIFNVQWSYEIYPAIVIVAIAACCLIGGLPITFISKDMRKNTILALLALPAFSLGGIVFGANLGFLPQTIGLSLGMSFLIISGHAFSLIIKKENTSLFFSNLALLSAILFSAATFAYSEVTPFLLAAFFVSAIFVAIRYVVLKEIAVFSFLFSMFSIILLNLEIGRVIKAVLRQSNAVTGTMVDWSVIGYVSHAFGIHGGAWDIMQWSSTANGGVAVFMPGTVLLVILIGIMIFSRKIIWKYVSNGMLAPVTAVLIIFAFCFLYFRYFVASPFPGIIGQGWSQFKISDWAHPFLMVLILISFVTLKKYLSKSFDILVWTIFLIGLIFGIITSVNRTKPLINSYGNTHNLYSSYIDLRNGINRVCPMDKSVYFNLDDPGFKVRQMVALFLPDRDLKSDWTTDGYIYINLSEKNKNRVPEIGDCVVEFKNRNEILEIGQGERFNKFNVGIFDGSANMKIDKITGAYGNESDGVNYWNWVENKVSFELRPMAQPLRGTTQRVRIFFEYATIGSRNLNASIVSDKGENMGSFVLNSEEGIGGSFEKIIDISSSQIFSIVIESDGNATRLNKNDSRLASFLIRNIKIQQYNNK